MEAKQAENNIPMEPFSFEVRVKARLDSEKWTSWFDDLTLTSQRGETLLRGTLEDHSALYGLLARLRDLAVPLISVRVIDYEARQRLLAQNKRMEILFTSILFAIFALFGGGLAALAVFFSPSILPVAFAMALLFTALGGLGHAFYVWTQRPYWHLIGHASFFAAIVSFLIFIPTSGLLPAPVGIFAMLVLAAGFLLSIANAIRQRTIDLKENLSGTLAKDKAESPSNHAGSSD